MSSNVEQIKEKLDIVEVISSYIKIEKAGVNFKARCPFHNEKTPSFLISPARQTFYCFGCGEKGDIFSFVEKFESLDFKGAMQTLADRAGIKLQKFGSSETSGREEKEKERMLEIMEESAKFFEKQLTASQSSLEYLKKRGVKDASIAKWRIGFAKDAWRDLHDHLLGQKFSKEEMLSAGLIKKVPNEDKYYDTFRNRIVFPICDSAGRVIAFSGRTMQDSLASSEENKAPKYLNSPETKLFYKSETLHGFHIAKQHIRKLDYAVLVEGQMDLVMSHQIGVLNTVASSGTALTELHLKKLQKLSNRVVLNYDSDSAGEKASIKAAELALFLGMEAKVASLPPGEDPASLALSDPQKLKDALKESEHFTDFLLNRTLRENAGRNLTREILKTVLPAALLLKSEIERSQFIKKIARKLSVSEESVRDDLRKIPSPKAGPPRVENEREVIKKEAFSLERLICGLVFLEESASKSDLRQKWEKILPPEQVAEVLERYFTDKEALIFEAEMHFSGGSLEKTEEEILRRIELDSLKEKIRKLAAVLDNPDISEEAEKEAKSEFTKIQKRIKEIDY